MSLAEKSLIKFFVLIVIAAATVIWWKHTHPSATWRYKITVTVNTPEGIKTGSAVREVGAFTDIKMGDYGGGGAGVTGEAVVIDLGLRGVLFALVSGDEYPIVFQAFPGPPGLTPDGMQYYGHLKNVSASLLQTKSLPQFFYFKDLNNPLTGQIIDVKNLEPQFGLGVRVRDVTIEMIEMSDAPITSVIYQYLPWLRNHQGNLYGDRVISQGGPLGSIDKNDFIVGELR